MSQEQIHLINGVQLWTTTQGRWQPIVLCHGGPGGYDYLQPIADMISDLCQVIRYDPSVYDLSMPILFLLWCLRLSSLSLYRDTCH